MKKIFVYNNLKDSLNKVLQEVGQSNGEVTKFKVLPYSTIVEKEE